MSVEILHMINMANVLLILALIEPTPQVPNDTSLQESITLLAENADRPIGDNPALERMAKYPREEMLDVLIKSIDEDQRFREPRARAAAYSALGIYGIDHSAKIVNPILRGLKETDVQIQVICIGGLSRLRPEHYPEIVASLAEVWEGIDIATVPPTQGESVDRWELVRLLLDFSAKIGSTAKPLFVYAERIFRAERFDRYLRSRAAFAMIRIGSIEDAWDHFKNLDPIGESAVIWTLGLYHVEESNAGSLDDATAKKIQNRILSGLKHPAAEVRIMSLRNLKAGFGEIKPELRSRVEELSKKDPDKKVRATAASVICEE